MSNAIHNIISKPADLQLEAATGAAPTGAGNATATVRHDPVPLAPADRTTLSALGGLLNSTVQTAATLSSFRPDRVNELKSAIASGSYQPDLGRVAQRVAQALNGAGQ